MVESIYDLETRATSLARKYAAYLDDEENKRKRERPTDAFETLYQQMEDLVDDLVQKAEAVQSERNRAVVAQCNAEIRRGKASLRGYFPKLHKLARKKPKLAAKNGGVGGSLDGSLRQASEIMEDRMERLAELQRRVDAISDGVSMAAPQDPKGKGLAGLDVRIDHLQSHEGRDASYFQRTETSTAFRDEYERHKQQTDADLDDISLGLNALKEIAGSMGEELHKQEDLVDVMESKADTANAEVRTVNAKLKSTLTQLRSSRNLCMDITLICVVLGIAAYIYSWFS